MFKEIGNLSDFWAVVCKYCPFYVFIFCCLAMCVFGKLLFCAMVYVVSYSVCHLSSVSGSDSILLIW